jgi:hypothetical protein
MSHSYTMAILVLAVSALATALGAQDTVVVAVGTRLRVRPAADAPWQYGRFGGVVRDTLLLGEQKGGGSRRYALAALQTIDLRRTDGSLRNKHAGKGTVLGVLGGALALHLLVRHCEATSTHSGDGPPCAIGYTGLPIFMGAGALAGTLVGVAWPAKRWRAISLRR